MERRTLKDGSRKEVGRVGKEYTMYHNSKSAETVGIEKSTCHNRRNCNCQNNAKIKKNQKQNPDQKEANNAERSPAVR
jgi:hypothetical protein